MKRGWWTITYTAKDQDNYEVPIEPSESDLEHIAKLVSQGYREGELNIQEDDTPPEDDAQQGCIWTPEQLRDMDIKITIR